MQRERTLKEGFMQHSSTERHRKSFELRGFRPSQAAAAHDRGLISAGFAMLCAAALELAVRTMAFVFSAIEKPACGLTGYFARGLIPPVA